MKKEVEIDIGWYINQLPEYKNPIKIHFHWVEENKKRDLDNVCFAKKFILDSMVKAGKLKLFALFFLLLLTTAIYCIILYLL